MIGNLTLDKSNMNMSYFIYAIILLKKNDGNMTRKDFTLKMSEFVGVPAFNGNGRENRTAYNKTKFPRYFGFINVYLDKNKVLHLTLTQRGKTFLSFISEDISEPDNSKKYSIKEEYKKNFVDLLVDIIIFDSFGRNNCGAEQSNTDIDPVKIIFIVMQKIKKATADEILFLIFGLNNQLFDSLDAGIISVKENRNSNIYNYSSYFREWGLENIAKDFKLLNIFANENIKLLVVDNDSNSDLSFFHLNSKYKYEDKFKTLSFYYKPLNYIFYSNSKNRFYLEKWVLDSILGKRNDFSNILMVSEGVDNLKQIFKHEYSEGTFIPNKFEEFLLKAFNNYKRNIYLVLKFKEELNFENLFSEYIPLLKRIKNYKLIDNGWSENYIENKKLYKYLIDNSSFAKKILIRNQIRFPSNLHIIGIGNMDKNFNNNDYDMLFTKSYFINTIEETKKNSIDEKLRINYSANIILYGVPGSGKSYTIENKILDKDTVSQRIVFHPDYAYSDFVGQILPKVDETGQIKYEFIAGPFTNILKKAYNNPQKKYALVIEEINRGNAPAIFGEIFQLLDRLSKSDNNDSFPIGTSAYEIMNENIARIVYGESTNPIRIPSNLSIIATMNTSDQNVFTLDTAFQRRWEMRLVENKFNAEDSILANKVILDTGVTWKNFCETINKYIIKSNSTFTSSEDKRLGKYFVKDSDLEDDQTNNQRRKFAEKVIKYLWDDAFKFNRDLLFENELTSLEDIVNQFIEKEGIDRFSIFTSNIFDKLTESNE